MLLIILFPEQEFLECQITSLLYGSSCPRRFLVSLTLSVKYPYVLSRHQFPTPLPFRSIIHTQKSSTNYLINYNGLPQTPLCTVFSIVTPVFVPLHFEEPYKTLTIRQRHRHHTRPLTLVTLSDLSSNPVLLVPPRNLRCVLKFEIESQSPLDTLQKFFPPKY